jgi:hypothetical protein
MSSKKAIWRREVENFNASVVARGTADPGNSRGSGDVAAPVAAPLSIVRFVVNCSLMILLISLAPLTVAWEPCLISLARLTVDWEPFLAPRFTLA